LKGWPELLAAIPLAAARLGRPLLLTVAGHGTEQKTMEAEARRLGIAAEFVGWVGPERRTQLYRNADLVAVPSVAPESFGLVGIEAGCVGLPAVAFAAGGIPEWLVAGVTGESAPGDRPTAQGLADAMVRALADPSHWQRLRQRAWEMANSFSPERHMALLEPILDAAAHSQPLAPA
jgi:glycosyltransferase involved in cell wall biosynthesis